MIVILFICNNLLLYYFIHINLKRSITMWILSNTLVYDINDNNLYHWVFDICCVYSLFIVLVLSLWLESLSLSLWLESLSLSLSLWLASLGKNFWKVSYCFTWIARLILIMNEPSTLLLQVQVSCLGIWSCDFCIESQIDNLI